MSRPRFGSGDHSAHQQQDMHDLHGLRFPDIQPTRRLASGLGNGSNNVHARSGTILGSMVGGTVYDEEDADAADAASRRMLVS